MDIRSAIQSWWVRAFLICTGLCAVAGTAWSLLGDEPVVVAPFEKLYAAEVEHVRSGHAIIIKPDLRLIYAGIRAPYAGEPLYDQAKRRNEELVFDRRIRVRYDVDGQQGADRAAGYVFVGGVFVNELLVREGLAYVRLTTETRRYNDRLLAAQTAAIKKRKGLWGRPTPSPERAFFGDPKYGNFHRPSCEETPKIKPERLTSFKTRRGAFAKGFAPCRRCNP